MDGKIRFVLKGNPEDDVDIALVPGGAYIGEDNRFCVLPCIFRRPSARIADEDAVGRKAIAARLHDEEEYAAGGGIDGDTKGQGTVGAEFEKK